jgi:hypothetical protein
MDAAKPQAVEILRSQLFLGSGTILRLRLFRDEIESALDYPCVCAAGLASTGYLVCFAAAH